MGRGTNQPPPFGQMGNRPPGLPAFDQGSARAAVDQFRQDHPFPTNPGFPFPGGQPPHIPSPVSGPPGGSGDFLNDLRGRFGGGGAFPGGGVTGGNFPGGGRSDVSPNVRIPGVTLPRTFSPMTSASGSGANRVRSVTGSNQ